MNLIKSTLKTYMGAIFIFKYYIHILFVDYFLQYLTKSAK